MASNSLALRFKMLGDVSGLTRATSKAGKDLSKLGKTTSSISKGMKSALGGIGLGLSLGGVVTYLKQAVEGAELARQADAKVLQVAKSMNLFGKETQTVTDRLGKYADAMELSTGQTAEVTKQVQSTLLTFAAVAKTADKAGGIFDRATVAAADLAAAGFGTAESNAVQLGKALNDPIKGISALSKAGVTFTDVEKSKIKTLVKSNQLGKAQNIVLKAIEKQVGGVAEKTALSSVKLANAFGQVSDQIGAVLLPYLDKLAKWVTSKEGQAELKKLAGDIVNLIKEAGKLAKWALDNKDTVLAIAGAFAALKLGKGLIDGYKTLLGVWKSLKTVGKLISPPNIGTPPNVGTNVPGGNNTNTTSTGVGEDKPSEKDRKKKPPKGTKLPNTPKTTGGKLTGIAAVAAFVLAQGGSAAIPTAEDTKAVDDWYKTLEQRKKNPGFGTGDLLKLPGAQEQKGKTLPISGGLGIVAPTQTTNITVNVTQPVGDAAVIINAIKRYASRNGKKNGTWNLGSL